MNDFSYKSYSYKPKATTIIFCILFFSACTLTIGTKAATNDRGLILNGIFTFSEAGASIFYWTLSALSAGFVAIGILLIIQRATGSLALEITDSEILIPKGFINKTVDRIALHEIENVSETEIQGQRFFYLHTNDRKYCINRAFMPSNQDYEEAICTITNNLDINPSDDSQ